MVKLLHHDLIYVEHRTIRRILYRTRSTEVLTPVRRDLPFRISRGAQEMREWVNVLHAKNPLNEHRIARYPGWVASGYTINECAI